MVNGNSVVLQLGKETTYGTAATPDEQIKISSESLKEVYNKIDEGLAVGGRGAGMVATMGIGVEGSFSTLLRPDMGKLLAATLGTEADVVASTVGHLHTFTAVEPEGSLPSLTAIVDRKVEKFSYSGLKVASLSLSADAGGYVTADVSFNGKKETSGATLQTLTPSALKAFKFAGGKAYIDDVAIADVTSMSLEINNNLDAQIQTTDTGVYYKEPAVGVREITSNLSMIYSASAESVRNSLYKTDNTFALKLEFTSDEEMVDSDDDEKKEAYKMTILLPCCQMDDANANMGGLETLMQDISVRVCDNLDDELITVLLINAKETKY